ncbi:hypothetical protein GQ43DRAFT_363710 [Delitschia confertaspora ATCC 74209]|uniref:RING-type domain-containing protein n=1 Tax=Delitschia confertaspora ATCC 74209 TaxID=1513339 RepID=A0A9P4MVN1_9PLEO|nr:hypothetical protein GQ43DRAFT_363710 [Delitschia confertaspora ATCC 74209]
MFSNGAFGRTPGQANAVHVDFNFTDLDGLPERYSPEASMSNTVNFDTVLTEQECQQKILDVFPDIERDHVLNLIRERSAPVERTARWCERLIGAILDGGQYPKERDKVKELKRKRSDDEDDELIAQYENARGENQDRDYFRYGAILLQDEFREIPVKHIENTLRKERTLFKAFDTLETQLDNYGILKAGHKASPFSKIRTPRASSQQAARKKSQMSDYVNLPQLQKEFAAARKQRTRKKTAAKLFEDSNTRRAQENNEMKECMCCYSDFPINRMAYCNGSDVHFFCVLCTQKYVENELSMSRCRPICFADLQCKTLFTTQQLRSILDKAAFERLELLQQQEDIRLAGLDNLEECPFCDFKAECPPVEVDREFRCMNLTCEKISCRLCRAESHIPMTCEEHQKENKASVRHAIEEAMTKALIRSCNRCKKPFVKDYGCNKMTCPSCGNAQCYVCGTNVSGNYDHFHNSHGRCPLYDNTDQRHQDEVKKAEEEALAILRAQHPNLSAKELKIQVSDRVKAEEEARIRRGADHAGGRLPLPIGFAERIVVPGRFGPMRRVDMPGYYPPPRGAVDAGVQAAGPPLRWQPVGELDLQQWVHAPPPFQAVGPPGVYLPLQAQAAAAPGNGNNNIAQPFVPVGPHEWYVPPPHPPDQPYPPVYGYLPPRPNHR